MPGGASTRSSNTYSAARISDLSLSRRVGGSWAYNDLCSLSGCYSLIYFQTQRIPELRFSATLGEEPEVELAVV